MSYKDLTVAEIIAHPESVNILIDIRLAVSWTREVNDLLAKIHDTEQRIKESLNARK